MEIKRKADDQMALVNVKKSRTELVTQGKNSAIVSADGIQRTSSLFAPIMLLDGHEAEVFSLEFHPDGQYLASGGFDRKLNIWTVYGECQNISQLIGHTGAIMELHFNNDGGLIYSASTDNTLAIWDVQTGTRVKKLKGHTAFVNSCHPARRGPQLVSSGSDDCCVKIWDPRKRGQCVTLNNTYQVCAVSFSDTSEQVMSAGIDNDVKVWDLRKNAVLYRLKGHTDTVTGLSLSPDGSYILSNSMDNTLRIWDVRPFAPQERCVKILAGHSHGFEKNLLRCAWAPDGSKVSAGSGDRFVYLWDTTTRRILYKLPGHNGSVNDVDFHPKEPIIMSGSSDKQIYIGEIE